MLALVLVAVSLGLDNFAAAIGIGVSGVSTRTRIEVGIVFGLFEVLVPIVGLVLGHGLARHLGQAAQWLGGGLLIATGLSGMAMDLRARGHDTKKPVVGKGRLVLLGLALSIDNLVVGFALGAYRVSVVVAALVIGLVSVTLSLVGLELGVRLGSRVGDRAELVGSLVLVGVGAAIAAGVS
ncbi:MAG TPA: manganese efflux pump [Acidimicrobiales bacterium]|nr:manganese efflux pump [Acidimicrobiales bacterium]